MNQTVDKIKNSKRTKYVVYSFLGLIAATAIIILILMAAGVFEDEEGVNTNDFYIKSLNKQDVKYAKEVKDDVVVTIKDSHLDSAGNVHVSTNVFGEFHGPKPTFIEADKFLHIECEVDLDSTTTSGTVNVFTDFTGKTTLGYKEMACNVVVSGTINSDSREVFVKTDNNNTTSIGFISATDKSVIGITYTAYNYIIYFTGSLTLGGASDTRSVNVSYSNNMLKVFASPKNVSKTDIVFGSRFDEVATTGSNVLTFNTGKNDFVYRSADDEGTTYSFSGKKL